MPYFELSAFRLPPGEDVERAMHRALAADVDDVMTDRPPTAEERVALEALAADLLRAVDPEAVRTDDEDGVTLFSRRVQVLLGAAFAGVAWPMGVDARTEEGREVLARGLEYVAALRERGWTFWDPQAESLLGDDVAGAFARGRAALAERSPARQARRRPWWRRLLDPR
jgi:hypothetical protein